MLLKRITAFLVCICLGLFFSACGNTDNNRTSEPASTAQVMPQEQQNSEAAKKETDDFSKGTVTRTAQNIEYKIPAAWGENSDNEFITYYYPKHTAGVPMLMVAFDEIESELSITDEGVLSDFIAGVQNSESLDNFNLSEQSIQTTASNIKCGYAEYSCTISDIDMQVKLAVFDCQGGLVSFTLGMSPDDSNDYTKDFYRILNSIEVEQDLTKGDVGEFYISIGECSFTTDYNGNKVIVINYDFINNSEETVAPFWKTNGKAFQDGIELETAIVLNGSYDAGIKQKEIRPGVTLNGCQDAYVLRSDSPVEFEMGAMFGEPVLYKIFDVQ